MDEQGEQFPPLLALVARIKNWGGYEGCAFNGALVEITDYGPTYVEVQPLKSIAEWRGKIVCLPSELRPANATTKDFLESVFGVE